MIRIALTGGPCGGKTTVTNYLTEHFGSQIIVQPETATMLMSGGFPKPGRDTTYNDAWAHNFQKSILATQHSMEEEYARMAANNMTRVVVCDRGLLDGAAFFGKPLLRFLDLLDTELPGQRFPNSTNLQYIYDRYDCVIHMESVACANYDLYNKLRETNPERIETAQEAENRDRDLRDLWGNHPNFHLIVADEGMKTRLLRVANIIAGYLQNEIEVKFLCEHLPTVTGNSVPVLQGYLQTAEGVELRIRQMGDECFITVKDKGLLSRMECERRITQEAFNALWPSTEGRRIEKRRTFVPDGDITWEVDVYGGPLSGLCTVEAELKSKEQRQTLVNPGWLVEAGATDVTENKDYKNFALATKGYPGWRD